MSSGSRSRAKPGEKDVIKTFRLPGGLLSILTNDARKSNTTLTELVETILMRYTEFDRLAMKFGSITFSKSTLKGVFEAIPDERIREIGSSTSDRVGELTEFWFSKRDLDSVLALIGLVSKYMNGFEYISSQRGHELTITMRSDLGRKYVLFLGTYWENGIAKVLHVTPKVEIGENQVTLTMHVPKEAD